MPGESFDRAASYYDATRGFPEGVPEQIRDAIVRAVGAGPETHFLEVGVGTGRIALPFIRAGYHYMGVDLSLAMMAEVRRKLTDAPTAPALVRGDVMHLPLADASFDVVIGVHVLHLLDDWRQGLREARRVLRPVGHMIFSQSGWNSRAGEPPDPSRLVGERWNAILKELGVDRSARPRGQWMDDQEVLAELRAMGATAELVTLLEYRRPGSSAREAVDHFRNRIYSSDWHTPEEVHAEAARRLERWLAEECPDPDAAPEGMASFNAVVAAFTGHNGGSLKR
ncbi:MAG TPA: class I SAM-dependent methyltransferase [Roseiflexaceae bacterium]|nr:class I SAM-dependent methyltransferase [Roseiflexaceae bacterium]